MGKKEKTKVTEISKETDKMEGMVIKIWGSTHTDYPKVAVKEQNQKQYTIWESCRE